MMRNTCYIYNYDDNTIGCLSDDIPHLTMKLQRSIGELLNWYKSNYTSHVCKPILIRFSL